MSSSRPASIDERIYQYDQDVLKHSALRIAQRNDSILPPAESLLPRGQDEFKSNGSQDNVQEAEASLAVLTIETEVHQAPVRTGQEESPNAIKATTFATIILQRTYFDVIDILAQYRQCLDIAISMHKMCRKGSIHEVKALQTIRMMNDIDVARRPYQFRLVALNQILEQQVGRGKWSFIKRSRVRDARFTRWMEEEVDVWNERLEQVGECARAMRGNRCELEGRCQDLTRISRLTAIRLELFDDHELSVMFGE